MKLTDHYALLVAINHYPGLSHLDGPENDASEFYDWLVNDHGGNVIDKNVKLIKSSDFLPAADNPYDANPTERQIVRALDSWLRDGSGWQEKVGARLYLYFAGHGFTTGSSNSNPALFMANAQNGDPVHLAGYSFASKIANAGFFDEIVLIMDCCQDVLKATTVLDPTWSPPDRGLSGSVKLLQAYGAPRGRKAFEDNLNGKKRGLFSTVFLEALNIAPVDSDGWVTGQKLKETMLSIWARDFKARTNYDPPIRLPDAQDIKIFQRQTNAPIPTVQVDVSSLVARGGETLMKLDSSPSERRVRGTPMNWKPEDELPLLLNDVQRDGFAISPGYYALDGSKEKLLIEISPRLCSESVRVVRPEQITSLELKSDSDDLNPIRADGRLTVSFSASDPGAEIIITDANHSRIGSALDTLQLELAPGLYKATAMLPGASSETWIQVDASSGFFKLPEVKFASSAPLQNSLSTHEYQQDAVTQAIKTESESIGKGGEVFLFVRDSRHEWEQEMSSPLPWSGLQLVSLDRKFELPLNLEQRTNKDRGCAYRKLSIPPGSYLLVAEENCDAQAFDLNLLVHVVTGWRTEVYLDCIDVPDDDGSTETGVDRIIDLASAAVFLAKPTDSSLIENPSSRANELASLRLSNHWPGLLPDEQTIEQSPFAAILAAYSIAIDKSLSQRKRYSRVKQILKGLPVAIRREHPDARTLELWLNRSKVPKSITATIPLPTVAIGWELLKQSHIQSDSYSQAVEAVGQWKLSGSLWTYTRVPRAKAESLNDKLRQGVATKSVESADSNYELLPAWSDAAWNKVLRGLRQPNVEHSPFQQALRRRIIDSLEEPSDDSQGSKEGVFEDLMKAFGVDRRLATQAYNELYQYALASGK